MPSPSGADPRSSTAWAATTSSVATTSRASSTISDRRRAASGAIVIRSSIPSACAVDTSSNDTGWARSLASAAIDCTAIPIIASPASARSTAPVRPVGSPDQAVSRSFTARSDAADTADARALRTRSSARATGSTSKFATEITRSSSGTTTGFPCDAFSSIVTCRSANASASRVAPRICGRFRNVSGSCRCRGAPGSKRRLPSR